jgi:hypothetical protein
MDGLSVIALLTRENAPVDADLWVVCLVRRLSDGAQNLIGPLEVAGL